MSTTVKEMQLMSSRRARAKPVQMVSGLGRGMGQAPAGSGESVETGQYYDPKLTREKMMSPFRRIGINGLGVCDPNSAGCNDFPGSVDPIAAMDKWKAELTQVAAAAAASPRPTTDSTKLALSPVAVWGGWALQIYGIVKGKPKLVVAGGTLIGIGGQLLVENVETGDRVVSLIPSAIITGLLTWWASSRAKK